MSAGADPAGAAEPDCLELCLSHAGTLLQRSVTPAIVQSVRTQVTGALTVPEAIDAARRAGILAAFGKLDLNAISDEILPLIVLLEDDRAVVIEQCKGRNRFVMFDPHHPDGRAEIRRDALRKSHTGYALLLRAEYRGGAEGGTAPHPAERGD